MPEEEDVLAIFEKENAPAIAAEEGKPFQLTGATLDELPQATDVASAVAARPKPEDTERLSTLQKINNLNVAGRVKLAFLGNKEERMILIRDGSKVVSSAVLQSPKITDQEVEVIAAMKNVQESVLRDVARNRKFVKNYNVVKSLVNNPKCPLDLSLALMKNLMLPDLKGLSLNKNVPETLKKLALKHFSERTGPGKR
jgi:hypothetical protein